MPPFSSTFNPEELLKVASDLLDSPSESKIRTILNRSYYSCYMVTKKSKKKINATDKYTHDKAYHDLQYHKVNSSQLKSLYYKLNRFRVAADYGLHSYQTGTISTSIRKGPQKPVDLEAKQTGINAIECAREFISLY